MRAIQHPLVVAEVHAWLRATASYARSLETKNAKAEDRGAIADRRVFIDLLDGCVAWLWLSVPSRARHVDEDARPSTLKRIALWRLGVRESGGATLDQVIRRHYLRVIEASEARTGVAASILGVSRRTVQRFLLEPLKGHRR